MHSLPKNVIPVNAKSSRPLVAVSIIVTPAFWHFKATSQNKVIASAGDSFAHSRSLYRNTSDAGRAWLRAQEAN